MVFIYLFIYCILLYPTKYSYLIHIICKQINLVYKFDPNKYLTQSAGATEHTVCIPAERYKTPTTSVLKMMLKIWWWGSTYARVLGNAEYLFIAIAPMSTLTRGGSTW